MPLITPEVEQAVYAAILNKCQALKYEPLAIGGMPDHVHLLVRFPTSLSVADLLKEIKGTFSHLITHEVTPDTFFKWQGAYGSFTVDKDGVNSVKAYIERQKEHHSQNSLQLDWEQTVTADQ